MHDAVLTHGPSPAKDEDRRRVVFLRPKVARAAGPARRSRFEIDDKWKVICCDRQTNGFDSRILIQNAKPGPTTRVRRQNLRPHGVT